jgi:hypothetical protein
MSKSHNMSPLYCGSLTMPSLNALMVSKKEGAGADKSLCAPSTSRYLFLATKSEVEERRPQEL